MKNKICILFSIFILLLAACSTVSEGTSSNNPAVLRFDGQRALALESEFVNKFPDRSSGQPNSAMAVEWLKQQITDSGWLCQVDAWTVTNYSRQVSMQNVVCRLPGTSPQEIVVAAHHDQSPATVQGADNDGSGIAILLHLAEIFGSEKPLPYTLVFVASDGEEYGMLGTRRFIQTHPGPQAIIAGFSLDNLGNNFYTGMDMDASGQFRNYGPLWLQLLARQTAQSAGNLWVPKIRPVLSQITAQAVPISFTDQGPMVAVGVPAFNFGGTVPPNVAGLYWQIYHTPQDVIENQSASVLGQTGGVTEALLRQLLSMKSFPTESTPYLYFEESHQALRGVPLWALFIGFVSLFFVGSYFAGSRSLKAKLPAWRNVLPHFLSIWLPLIAAIFQLYFFVLVGIMDRYELYPATTKDPAILNPRWPAVIFFLLGLGVYLYLGRWLARRFTGNGAHPEPDAIKSFALFVTGLACVYILAINPFSLLFCLPLLLWFLILGRKGTGRMLDILFFALGGLVVYALFYFFGFLIQHTNFAVLWYILMMFSVQMIGPLTALAITAIIAAGLSMIVRPPVKA